MVRDAWWSDTGAGFRLSFEEGTLGLGGLEVCSKDSEIHPQIAGQGVSVSSHLLFGLAHEGAVEKAVNVSNVGSKENCGGRAESRGGNGRPLRGPTSTTYHWNGEVMERA